MAVKKEAFFFYLFLIAATEINGGDGFEFLEATIDSIQAALAEEKLTSRELVEFYLRRISELNPTLRAVVEVDPTAMEQAGESDRRRRDGRSRSRWMEGIPVMVKDTMATKEGTNTTAGSFAMVGSVAARDAGVVAKLRAAGAVILGKSSLTEWYSFRAMGRIPNAWCARSGQALNPYVPKGDPCGSSSGSAISVAANMVAVSLGSDTHGSILCPSDHNSVVGLRPTVGLTARSGVIPVFPPHDTVGPITRTVSDAVYVLDAIVGFDENDEEATKEAAKLIPSGGYIQFLKSDGLRGKRLGVVRNPFVDSFIGTSVLRDFEDHLNTLRRNGATIVDDLEIENVDIVMDVSKSGELAAMLAGFKLSLNNYLKELIVSPVRSLADIIAFNENHPNLEKTNEYGQHTFIESEKTSGIADNEREAIERMRNLSRDGFEKLMSENELDTLIMPGTGCIPVLAIGGYPGITVPAGYEEETGMPFGLCFGGLKGSEPKLIEAAYTFEQASLIRRPPFLELVQVE